MDRNQFQLEFAFFLEPERFGINFSCTETGIFKSQIDFVHKRFFTFTYQYGIDMHRAGQRCFELLALIGSPQLLQQGYSLAVVFFYFKITTNKQNTTCRNCFQYYSILIFLFFN